MPNELVSTLSPNTDTQLLSGLPVYTPLNDTKESDIIGRRIFEERRNAWLKSSAAPLLHGVLADPQRRPSDCIVKPLAGGRDYIYLMSGEDEASRVTTAPEYFEEHSGSCELWSPKSPAFP